MSCRKCRVVPILRALSVIGPYPVAGADPGFLKMGGGVHLRFTRKKGGGSRRGSNFRPNVKKPSTWAKKGGPPPPPDTPLDPAMIRVILAGDPGVWV